MKSIKPFKFFIVGILMIIQNGWSQTQLDMNQYAGESFKKVDAELNRVYKQILLEYADESFFLNNLKNSQRNWIKFRDSEVLVRFPRKPEYYGSSYAYCVSAYMEELTRTRVLTLRVWLEGAVEGDMCSGTIRLNN